MSGKESYSVSAHPELMEQVETLSDDKSRSAVIVEAIELLLKTKSSEERVEQIEDRISEVDQEICSLQQEKSELKRELKLIEERLEAEEGAEFDEERYQSLLEELVETYDDGYDITVWDEFKTAVSMRPEDNNQLAEQEVFNDLDQMVGDAL